MHIKSAKDIWAALKVIHAGSADQQNLIKHDRSEERRVGKECRL